MSDPRQTWSVTELGRREDADEGISLVRAVLDAFPQEDDEIADKVVRRVAEGLTDAAELAQRDHDQKTDESDQVGL